MTDGLVSCEQTTQKPSAPSDSIAVADFPGQTAETVCNSTPPARRRSTEAEARGPARYQTESSLESAGASVCAATSVDAMAGRVTRPLVTAEPARARKSRACVPVPGM